MKKIFFNMLQLMGGIIATVGCIPQIYQILVTQSTKDINLLSTFLILIGIIMMEAYAIYLVKTTKNWLSFLITNTLSMLLQGFIVALVALYQ